MSFIALKFTFFFETVLLKLPSRGKLPNDVRLDPLYSCTCICKSGITSYPKISLITGMINGQLSVRPSKVVAGHEPEKTNEFLQAMGTAILNKVGINLD